MLSLNPAELDNPTCSELARKAGAYCTEARFRRIQQSSQHLALRELGLLVQDHRDFLAEKLWFLQTKTSTPSRALSLNLVAVLLNWYGCHQEDKNV